MERRASLEPLDARDVSLQTLLLRHVKGDEWSRRLSVVVGRVRALKRRVSVDGENDVDFARLPAAVLDDPLDASCFQKVLLEVVPVERQVLDALDLELGRAGRADVHVGAERDEAALAWLQSVEGRLAREASVREER